MNENEGMKDIKNSFKDQIQYFKDNPVEFFEEYYGVELHNYQKVILKMLLDKKNENKEIFINYPLRNGRTQMRKMIDFTRKMREAEEKMKNKVRIPEGKMEISDNIPATITMIPNGDGTYGVYVVNIDKLGGSVKIPKGIVEISVNSESVKVGGHAFIQKTTFTMEIECLPQNEKLYEIHIKNPLNSIKNDELIAELKKRGILTEETTYKCKKGE